MAPSDVDWSPDELPDGWDQLTDKESDARKRELKKEIAKRHRLFGTGLTPMAKCEHCELTLVDVSNEQRWALVLVTWRRVFEKVPVPVSEVFGQALPLDALLAHGAECAPV